MNKNRDTLGNLGTLWSKGVDYPERFSHFAKHSQFAFSIYSETGVSELMYGFKNDVPAQKRWEDFFDYVRTRKCPSVLISSEEFMRMGAHPKSAELLKNIVAPVQSEFHFKIIAYLRQPDAHLRSWYNQLIKLKQSVPDFNRTVCDVMEPIHYDYALALKPWIDIFGEKAVIVRTYTEALRHDNALFKDFLAVLGIPDDGMNEGRWKVPNAGINPRLKGQFLELTRISQNLGLMVERSDWLKENLTKQMSSHRSDKNDGQSFSEIVARSRLGIETLKSNRHTATVAEFLEDSPPSPDSDERSEFLNLVQLLMHENTVLRHRIFQNNSALSDRLTALENQLKTPRSDSK
ncbi:MAG: hypothetical protein JXR15_03835 [Shimia sp.]|uniref:hypothetical protein n=1 Tax=Shimia sp. TaxID=1954381 RepID=UPI003B8ADFF9